MTSTARSRPKLESIAQLEQELGQRRGRLIQLQADRDAEQERLRRIRAEYAELGEEIGTLDASLGAKNRQIFVLADDVDYFLRLHERVQERARKLAKKTTDEPSPSDETARTYPRETLVTEVSLKTETNFYVGFSENISEGGLFVSTYNPRPRGERFLVEFSLPACEELLRCMVEVAWVNEYQHGDDMLEDGSVPGMGLRFVGLEQDAREALVGFIETREPLFFPEYDGLS